MSQSNDTGPDPTEETLEEFFSSFSYGTRTDLSFKFLKKLPPERAAEFIRLLLSEVGELFDDPDPASLLDLVYRWQADAYAPAPGEQRRFTYDDQPWAHLGVPIDESTVALVTSSGHFASEDDPAPFGIADMSQVDAIGRIDEFLRATPELSAIPASVPESSLGVRHPGYDIRSASRDPGVAFPRDVLVDMATTGRVGRVSDPSYSFVGACAQGRIRQVAPGWVQQWKDGGADWLLLVPV